MENENLSIDFFNEFFNEDIFSINESQIIVGKKPDSERSAEIIPKNKLPQINFLGEFKKKILVLVEDSKNLFLDDEDQSFLGTVLAAITLDLNDIALVNMTHHGILNIDSILSELQPDKIIGFGLNSTITGQYKTNNLILIKKSQAIIMSYSLKEISQNLSYKRILWTYLKIMFPGSTNPKSQIPNPKC